MKAVNVLSLIMLVIGGLNWGLVGFAQYDVFAALLGPGSTATRVVYVLIGLAAIWELLPLAHRIQDFWVADTKLAP